MTFDDDFVRIEHPGTGHQITLFCQANGIEWPPAERASFVLASGRVLHCDLVSRSEITDDQRAGMTHVCRGALYRVAAEAVTEQAANS